MKRVFFTGVVIYSILMILLNDWPAAIGNTGNAALPWMGKCLVDIGFALIGLYKLFGNQIHFDEDEIGIHEDDISVPDTWLYGLFGLDLLANWGFHGYEFANQTGVVATYNSLWWMGESLAMVLTFVLYRHAMQVARREARKARNMPGPIPMNRNSNVA